MNEILTKVLADGLLVVAVVIAATALVAGIKKGKRFETYKVLLFVALSAVWLARIASLLPVEEVRPFIAIGAEAGAAYMDNPGFPSDHALLAFTLAYAVIFLTKYKKLGYCLFCLAILICVGRVLALVHTPLDVVGGLFVATVPTVFYLYWGRQKNER